MDHEEIARSLRVIRETMESSSRYTNIPALGYVAAGALGLIGPALTFWLLGPEKLAGAAFTGWDVGLLCALWTVVFFGAAGASGWLTIRRARSHGIRAWNSLAARMYLAQLPQVLATLVITIALVNRGQYLILPAVWLLAYGVILFGFSYFTGRDHFAQALIFLGLGAVAAFVSGLTALELMALGFGVTNLAFGAKALVKEWMA